MIGVGSDMASDSLCVVSVYTERSTSNPTAPRLTIELAGKQGGVLCHPAIATGLSTSHSRREGREGRSLYTDFTAA